MSVSVRRGENILLTREKNKPKDIFIGVAWKTKEKLEFDPDIDASLFLVGTNNKVRKDQDFIFYNNGMDENKCVIHISSEGDTDNSEGFIVHPQKIPNDVNRLVFNLTIHDWKRHRQNLHDTLDSATVKISDRKKNAVLAEHHLSSKDLDQETAIMLGEVYRHADGWKFRAISQGFAGGLDALARHFGISVSVDAQESDEEPTHQEKGAATEAPKRTRRSRYQVIKERTAIVGADFEKFLPQIQAACESQQNESNTRMILDRVLQDVFGYTIEEIRTEQVIQGRKADYVLSVDDRDVLVIEAKRAGMTLREKQIFQATSYGAYSGIKWALLTNLANWQLYRISACEKITANLVFEVDVKNGLDDEISYYLYLISRYGITSKGLLENLWVKTSALTYESLSSAILNEEVISKIRSVLNRESGSKLTNEEVKDAVEKRILQTD